ncbi:MAG: hypothetical protein EBZ08_09910, partial [Betaproteobacteria bacterium]|nr:hypothetical protein [Betaproteobacteria bacterium]
LQEQMVHSFLLMQHQLLVEFGDIRLMLRDRLVFLSVVGILRAARLMRMCLELFLKMGALGAKGRIQVDELMDLGLDEIECLDHGVHAASSLMYRCFSDGRMPGKPD